MLEAIKRFFTTCPYDGCNRLPDHLDYGNGFKAKQVDNGKWVLEFEGKAMDRRVPFYLWKPSSRYYEDCLFDTLEELQKDAEYLFAQRDGR